MSLLRFDPRERKEIVEGGRAALDLIRSKGFGEEARIQVLDLIRRRVDEAGIPHGDFEISRLLASAQ